ncbi:hypothetical protein MasN3_16610 [Massilia varians]|uniref:Uncharacterized protein n=1 Tax=Massilia varians TaxID=457921 RepID=A0ABM8C4P1_9BURK|nr:hypothetical protein MasN3_16610 [Massilia varians]
MRPFQWPLASTAWAGPAARAKLASRPSRVDFMRGLSLRIWNAYSSGAGAAARRDAANPGLDDMDAACPGMNAATRTLPVRE